MRPQQDFSMQILLFLLLSTDHRFSHVHSLCRWVFFHIVHPLLWLSSSVSCFLHLSVQRYCRKSASLHPCYVPKPRQPCFSNVVYQCNLLPSSFLVISFRILSLLDLRSILRSQLISATSILISSSFLRHQHSDPYIITGMTNVPYSFTLVAVVILFDLQILFIVPNIAEARLILRFTSLVQRPSFVITPPE